MKAPRDRAAESKKLAPTGRVSSSPHPPTSFAKITQAAVARSYARELVFEILDELSHHKLLWLSAHPGYGKNNSCLELLARTHTPNHRVSMRRG